jgi:hypothetical protein
VVPGAPITTAAEEEEPVTGAAKAETALTTRGRAAVVAPDMMGLLLAAGVRRAIESSRETHSA